MVAHWNMTGVRRIASPVARRSRPFGHRVRVFLQAGKVVVQWFEHGAPKQRSWPHTRDGVANAKVWAKTFADRRIGMVTLERVTTRELWQRYWAMESKLLRPRTQQLYKERWMWWERFVGPNTPAEDVTIETAGRFRAEVESTGKASNQVRLILGVARIAYNWGHRAKVIRENPLAAYRFKMGKDKRKNEPAEYRREDFDEMVAQLEPQHGAQWRAAVALLILGNQGARQNAVLHLAWKDVDFVNGVITWPAGLDKMGNTFQQPMRQETYAALLTAQWWQQRLGYTGPWVLPPARVRNGDTYRAQSLWYHIQRVERAAGVPHLELRAAHGLRRMVVNDILEETGGDLEAAAQFIGDKDLKVVRRSYRRVRGDRMANLADRLDRSLDVHSEASPKVPATTPAAPQSGITEQLQVLV